MNKIICYLKGCKLEVYPGSYWCTATHQKEWQEQNYGSHGENKRQKSIEEMQKRLMEMKKYAIDKR